MKRKKCKSKKHWPVKYRKYKGCFGSGPFESKSRRILIKMKEILGLRSEQYAEPAIKSLNRVMDYPDSILDMRDVKQISLRFGLILKAFFDEFRAIHDHSPMIYLPKLNKMKAVLNHLGITSSTGICVDDYKDITCWQIVDWEIIKKNDQENITRNSLGRDIKPPDLLHYEIIPKCWSVKHKMANDSSAIATSVSEMLFNCAEHAYTGEKEEAIIKKWYLGVGEYPDSKEFAFCIYDIGVGIKNRMKQNPRHISDNFFDKITSDSGMIKLATEGRSGADINDGRGQGLKNSIELLSANNGKLSIYSGNGVFESEEPTKTKDRKTYLEGTMIAFSFPINYS
jgi:hypothetical protein